MTLAIAALVGLLAQSGSAPAASFDEHALAVQVALDKAGFSPGAIDGRMGRHTRRAMDAFRQARKTDPAPDPEPIATYIITDSDAAAQLVPEIPPDLMKQSELPALAYTSLLEALAERFHATPDLLRALNPEAAFAAGEQIRVPGVQAFIVPAPRVEFTSKPQRQETGTTGRAGGAASRADDPPARPDVVVTVSKAGGTLVVRDGGGQTIFYAPVTTGSERDPLPLGEWKVTGVQYSPEFRYNPDLFWDADPSHAKATLKPGPNNPVGVVWIDLTKEHYGIHGTPEPASIGRTASHGCVRLTNWDAVRLAGLVKSGTRVVFAE